MQAFLWVSEGGGTLEAESILNTYPSSSETILPVCYQNEYTDDIPLAVIVFLLATFNTI